MHLNIKQCHINIKKMLDASFNKRNYAYFMEMGCGKSKVLLDNMAWLRLQKKIDTAIIVAPKGCIEIGRLQKFQNIF